MSQLPCTWHSRADTVHKCGQSLEGNSHPHIQTRMNHPWRRMRAGYPRHPHRCNTHQRPAQNTFHSRRSKCCRNCFQHSPWSTCTSTCLPHQHPLADPGSVDPGKRYIRYSRGHCMRRKIRGSLRRNLPTFGIRSLGSNWPGRYRKCNRRTGRAAATYNQNGFRRRCH